ncbi:MAG: hypothetical protein WAW88_08810 [Nocardioides sp.]
MSSPQILVQRITVHWTKDSRGGRGAAARNTAPLALPMPGHGVVWHAVAFSETDAFSPWLEAADQEVPQAIETELNLKVTADVASFLPLAPFGAPLRHRRPPRARIETGQSVRWILNSRDGRDHGWLYTQVVYNVALADAADTAVFTRDPAVVVDERAALR